MNTAFTSIVPSTQIYTGAVPSASTQPNSTTVPQSTVPAVLASNPGSNITTQRSGNLATSEEIQKKESKTSVKESENKQSRERQQVSNEELSEIRQLSQRDREVRAHEQAHRSAGGSLIRGGTSFTFTRGPDGKQYAVGGEVSIDTGAVPNDPKATIQKAQTIRRAALAPSNPSTADRQIAAQASSMEQQARVESMRAELEQQTQAAANDDNNTTGNSQFSNEREELASCPLCGGPHDSGAHSETSLTSIGSTMQTSYSPPPETLGFAASF